MYLSVGLGQSSHKVRIGRRYKSESHRIDFEGGKKTNHQDKKELAL